MTKQWYAVRTKPHCELMASRSLEHGGYNFYFPQLKMPVVPHGEKLIPMFTGYLFLNVDIYASEADLVNDLPGVLGWVHFGEQIPSIPDSDISKLKLRVDATNNSGGLWRRYHRGDVVHVASGKIEGLGEVVKDANSPHSKVHILLDFMGGTVAAQVPWETLSPVSSVGVSKIHRRSTRRTRGRGRWVRGFGPQAQFATAAQASRS